MEDNLLASKDEVAMERAERVLLFVVVLLKQPKQGTRVCEIHLGGTSVGQLGLSFSTKYPFTVRGSAYLDGIDHLVRSIGLYLHRN